MDLAPKQSKTQDSSTLKSTAESRLKNFMQEVTGRALVMMESATQNQQGIAMDLVQEAFISLHKSYSEYSHVHLHLPFAYAPVNHVVLGCSSVAKYHAFFAFLAQVTE